MRPTCGHIWSRTWAASRWRSCRPLMCRRCLPRSSAARRCWGIRGARRRCAASTRRCGPRLTPRGVPGSSLPTPAVGLRCPPWPGRVRPYGPPPYSTGCSGGGQGGGGSAGGWGGADRGDVVTGGVGTRGGPDGLPRLFRRLVAGSGLPPVTLHGLRHGAATLALAAGTDLKIVQDQLGHSTITLTADTYTSVLPETARAAADNTAALLFPARPRRAAKRRPGSRPAGR